MCVGVKPQVFVRSGTFVADVAAYCLSTGLSRCVYALVQGVCLSGWGAGGHAVPFGQTEPCHPTIDGGGQEGAQHIHAGQRAVL